MSSNPSYAQLTELLTRDEVSIDAAELQGSLVALLSGNAELTIKQWLAAAFGQEMTPGYVDDDAYLLLQELFAITQSQLGQRDFELELLLPDDEQPLADRTDALTHWASGYLSGLGQLTHTDPDRWSDDAREFLLDLVEISKAEVSTAGADEEGDEQAFVELIEYARVGALLVFESLLDRAPKPASGTVQ